MTNYKKSISVQKCIELYLGSMSNSSSMTYRYALQTISRHLSLDVDVPITALPWNIINYSEYKIAVTSMRSEGLRDATIKNYTYMILGVRSALFKAGLISLKEHEAFRSNVDKNQSSQPKPEQLVPRAEMDAILLNCKEDKSIIGCRDLALCALLFASGITRNKLTELKLSQINLSDGCIEPCVGESHNDVIYFATWAIPYIKPWMDFLTKQEGHQSYLFTKIFKSGAINTEPLTGRGIYYILSSRSKACELLRNVSPSRVRKAIGNSVVEDYGLQAAQVILGHISTSTTKKYEE